MRTRFITALMMVTSLLMTSQVLAQPRLPTFSPGDVLKASDLNMIVEQVKRHRQGLSGTEGETHPVDCDSGDTIKAAMDQAQPGDTIEISGTCNENVVVDKDGITLTGEGQDSTIIDGSNGDAAGVIIKGHQNVTVRGLTVQNGLNGIKIVEGAAAWLEDVTVRGSPGKEGHDSSHGILVSASASAVLTGAIVANNNAGNGIFVLNSSSVFVGGNVVIEGVLLPQASLKANGNGEFGIQVETSGSLNVFSGDSVPTTIQANNNSNGIGVWNGASAQFGGGASIEANDNGGFGMEVGLNSSLYALSWDSVPTTIVANRNATYGILLSQGGSVQFGGGADVEATGNGESGLYIANGSSAAFYAYTGPDRGFAGAFNNNGRYGIAVFNNASLSAYDNGVASSITATNNVTDGTGWGLLVESGSSAFFGSPSSETSSKLVLANNGHGAGVYNQGSVMLRMPSEIKDNALDGIEAWGNSFIEIDYAGANAMITGNGRNGISAWNGVGIYFENATITGNTGASVSAGQGSRLDWYGGQVNAPINCDDSVFAFGDASCPDDDDESDQ